MQKHIFEKFYRENIDRIYRYVFFRVGKDSEIAQDLVSEIFLKALNKFDSYDENVSKSAWIYTIARNHLSNYYRDKKETSVLEDIPENVWVDTSKEKVSSHDLKDYLDRAFHVLSKQEQKIVTMKYLEGYGYKDIGEVLNMKSGAVKMAAHRAMNKMKKEIQHYEGSGETI